MATIQAVAERRAKAVARLDKAKRRLAKDFKVKVNEQPITNRDPRLAEAQSLENVVAVLEATLDALDKLASDPEAEALAKVEAEAEKAAKAEAAKAKAEEEKKAKEPKDT